MPTNLVEVESIKQEIIGKVQRYNGTTIEEALPQQIYKAVASTVRDRIMKKWIKAKKAFKANPQKKLYYMSVEFLVGRVMLSNIINLLHKDEYMQAFKELNIDPDLIFAEEPEPGLGNGGLGRLASAFMDSLSTLDLPATGSTIRYEYGLFRQKILDGQQIEIPDNWLENGNVWEVPAPENAVSVHFGGTVRRYEYDGRTKFEITGGYFIKAIPYDMPIVGYDTDNVNSLRMWSARSPESFNLRKFGDGEHEAALQDLQPAEIISKVLYPEDNHYEGKMLRLKQHYFLASATIQDAIRSYKKRYGNDLHDLPKHVVFHINDTHPGLAIPELLRILLDDYDYDWDEAMEIVNGCMAYTNHTILNEALEKWPCDMMQTLLPRIYMLLEEMNKRLCAKLFEIFPGQWERIAHMAIIAYDNVHMANLCVSTAFSVNGVSQLHGEILKKSLFADYNQVYPNKFTAITNGITHRRWLLVANPELSKLIEDSIGPDFKLDALELKKLEPYADDPAFRDKFKKIKHNNKVRLAKFLNDKQGVVVDCDSIFDVQAKRLHEYKRQLLNALHILVLYNRIVDDPNFTMPPRTFFFGAKASPSYYRAKLIIRFINAIANLINKHPRARTMLNVVFVENYNVSLAELLMPAAEISQQLSTASKEASGTGNMKFMMNGAITLGTMDGANVEIYDAVGDDNIYIFGMRSNTVLNMYKEGTYNPMMIFEQNAEIRKAMRQMIDGSLFEDHSTILQDIYHSLLIGDNGSMADSYFVLKDFGSYSMANRRIMKDYEDQDMWQKKAIINVANSGIFSIDNTIKNYNEKIWHLGVLKLD